MIDWDVFRVRVPAGTMVRSIDPGHEWYAFLLENYPFEQEEIIWRDIHYEKGHEVMMSRLNEYPRLRIQDLAIANAQRVSPDWKSLEYFINGRWQSYAEVMK